jgi:hypothetical protein
MRDGEKCTCVHLREVIIAIGTKNGVQVQNREVFTYERCPLIEVLLYFILVG